MFLLHVAVGGEADWSCTFTSKMAHLHGREALDWDLSRDAGLPPPLFSMRVSPQNFLDSVKRDWFQAWVFQETGNGSLKRSIPLISIFNQSHYHSTHPDWTTCLDLLRGMSRKLYLYKIILIVLLPFKYPVPNNISIFPPISFFFSIFPGTFCLFTESNFSLVDSL